MAWAYETEAEPLLRPYTYAGLGVTAILLAAGPKRSWVIGAALTAVEMALRQFYEPYRFAVTGEHRKSRFESLRADESTTGAASVRKPLTARATLAPRAVLPPPAPLDPNYRKAPFTG